MLYPSFVKEITNLDFIQDEKTADAALKGALGSLVSIMDDDKARRLTRELPDPLDFPTLRGNQVEAVPRSLEDAATALAVQFDIGAGQAMELMKRSIHCVKTSVDLNLLNELFADLPREWRELIDIA